jgi:uridylate kinase
MPNEQKSTALYKRVLIKMSGEALSGNSQMGIDPAVLDRLANEIAEIRSLGVEVGIVVGGGNLFRGKALSAAGLGRVTGDHMGMLATVMNGLALRDALERIDLPSRIMSAIPMTGVVDPYNRRKAITHLRDKRIVIFAAGTGNPFFTTDSAACLRGIEIDADIVLKATKVDGIYSADPVLHPEAEFYSHVTYDEVIQKDLGVMDSTAICLCRDHNMPIRVFNLNKEHALIRVNTSESEGSLVTKKN